MTKESKRGPWERPHLLSVSIPVVEALLAESYKKKAEMWADAARQLRGVSPASDRGTPDRSG